MQLVSVKTIILKVIRDLGLGAREIPWQDLIEWCAEGLQHIGAYTQYIEKEANVPITNYGGNLPCDFYRMVGHVACRINGNRIITGMQSGNFCFTYLAIPQDEEGYPLIPDNVQYATALFWKCAMQLSIRGELANKELSFVICKQRWDWYCRQAGASNFFQKANLDTFTKHWLAAIPPISQLETGYLKPDPTHA